MKKTKKTLAIDFDNVIAEYNHGWLDTGRMGVPKIGAEDTIRKLKKKYTVVIYSCRKSELIREWLKENDFPYMKVYRSKPRAIAYIDDKAVRFYNWEKIKNDYLKKPSED
jgi:5'(3')-deoxyribonucleotidase